MVLRAHIAKTVLFFIAIFAGSNQLPAGEPSRFEFEETHMGTRFSIVFYADDREDAITAATAAFKRVRELEAVLSDYRSSSEVMKLCAKNDREPGIALTVSPDLADVLAHSLEISKQSQGAFDVTIGPLSKLWRDARKQKTIPDEAERAEALKNVGWNKIDLDREKKTVKFLQAGMRLDFGGIGKGFAADAALAVLKQHGYPQALVAAAGDITVGDAPPGKKGWIVEIEPIGAKQQKKKVQLVRQSVSTSGDLYQFVEIDGVRYSHLLDPRTGRSLKGFVRATVIAKNGWQADALTKAACLMPTAQAIKLIDNIDGAAMFLATKADDSAPEKTAQSRRFESFLVK